MPGVTEAHSGSAMHQGARACPPQIRHRPPRQWRRCPPHWKSVMMCAWHYASVRARLASNVAARARQQGAFHRSLRVTQPASISNVLHVCGCAAAVDGCLRTDQQPPETSNNYACIEQHRCSRSLSMQKSHAFASGSSADGIKLCVHMADARQQRSCWAGGFLQ